MFLERSLIAVDIGSSCIKMMEISGSDDKRKLKSLGMELLPPGAIKDGVIQENSAVKETVAKLAKTLGVKGRRVAVSLAGSGVLIRKVTVSLGKDVVLEEQIPYYAEQAFQLDPAGLYYDFVRLPPKSEGSDDIEILLVGARRETVEQYVTCVKEAGMKLGVIECNAFSLFNSFEQNYGVMEGLVALINIGASNTQINLVDGDTFLFSRDIPLGGAAYTQKISEVLSTSYDEAENLKLACFTTENARNSTEILRVTTELNEQLVHEISGTVNYFMRTGEIDSNSVVKYVFLTGGASRSPGLDATIAAALRAPVYPLNPFQRIDVSGKKFGVERMAAMSPMLGVATGLGLRRLKDKE